MIVVKFGRAKLQRAVSIIAVVVFGTVCLNRSFQVMPENLFLLEFLKIRCYVNKAMLLIGKSRLLKLWKLIFGGVNKNYLMEIFFIPQFVSLKKVLKNFNLSNNCPNKSFLFITIIKLILDCFLESCYLVEPSWFHIV
jgi:hypothetical protein